MIDWVFDDYGHTHAEWEPLPGLLSPAGVCPDVDVLIRLQFCNGGDLADYLQGS